MTARGLWGRRAARLIVATTLALDAFLAFWILTLPAIGGGPYVDDGRPQLGWLIVAVGAALHLAGLLWMIRIAWADPEAHPSFWRSLRR